MGTFEVTRSRRTAATPSDVHALVNDFHQWTRWSPWEELEPNLQRTYSGADAGVGARYAWKGNKKAGAGAMHIIESTPERIVVEVNFIEPFQSKNTSTYEFHPLPGGDTEIIWQMTGPQSRAQKLFFAVMRVNAKVAKDFDKGLAALAREAEQGLVH